MNPWTGEKIKMDIILAVLLGVLVYAAVCVCIAAIRAGFSKSGKRKEHFWKTFWSFFLEVLNPFQWLG